LADAMRKAAEIKGNNNNERFDLVNVVFVI
jgi:hypothetical protein